MTTLEKGRKMWGVKAGPPGHRIREEVCPEGLDSEPRKREYPGEQAFLTWGGGTKDILEYGLIRI